MSVIQAVRWSPAGDAVRIIDQTLLPERYEERDLRTLDDVCDAIARLAVRGAPAIGVAGALGLVVSMQPHTHEPAAPFRARLESYATRIRGTRPTAVNLSWALSRMLARAATMPVEGAADGTSALLDALREEATRILDEDRAMCRRIGEHGLPLIPDGARILTHCNAGALATAGVGTALAPVYLAAEAGRHVEVLADETRPLLQGSRLTAWELARAGIPVRVIADNMAASFMRAGRIDLCIVGADRIAANGDVANKIGTYGVAILARHHGIPLYVAAPTSTFDASLEDGDRIPIEQRARDEIARGFGRVTVPADVAVENPAFDVTPGALISAIISDRGIHYPPYDFSLRAPAAAASSGR
ncbi:MAG TPA: S-methyl-5-thioribose-1-phosphate isomerase [Gemmatimonadaceae bacterium]|nr:S-methyl-5-thioribose-1-phosphate isomerase [Gemmatimonadaceae bacterium]